MGTGGAFDGVARGQTLSSHSESMRINRSFRHAAVAAICGALWAANALAAEIPTSMGGGGGDPHDAACAISLRTGACEAKPGKKDRAKGAASPEQQRALLRAAVAALAPQRKGVVDLYTIGVAGWAEQDVFIKELDGALASLGKTLPTSHRVLRLVNHQETIRKTPLATRDNLAAAVREVGKIMDKNEDVLILFMTS